MLSRIWKYWDLILIAVVLIGLNALPYRPSTDPLFQDPSVSYSAHFSLLYGTHVRSGVVRHRPGWSRIALGSIASQRIYIDDLEHSRTILVVPNKHQYMQVPRDDHPFFYLQECFGVVRVHWAKRIGETTYEGIAAIRYRSKGRNHDITYWTTRDGLLLRFKGQATDNGLTFPIDYRLSGIEFKPQETRFFAPPPGYKRVSKIDG